jgi:hypothetical protein
VVAPGAPIDVTVSVENGTEVGRAIDLEVCVVDPPVGRGWTEVPCQQGSDLEVDAGKDVTRTRQVVAPATVGAYTVFLRWSDPPSGDFLPLPFRVTNVSAETLTARIELDSDTVEAGGTLKGWLVIDNPTNETMQLREGGCTPKWQVALARPGQTPDAAFTMECGAAPMTIPPGALRQPITIRAAYNGCTNAEPTDEAFPHCLADGGMPPLPIGDYEAVLATRGEVPQLELPDPVPVTVTE